MLKKTITYEDLEGNPVTEDFYFNLSKAELAEMELSHDGSFASFLEELIRSMDGEKIIDIFKKIIGGSIGRRSEDNKRFIKSEEIRQDFFQSDAYSVLFMELATEEDAAAAFVRGILPKDMQGPVQEQLPKSTPQETPAYILENRDPTKEEMANMSREELLAAFKRKSTSS